MKVHELIALLLDQPQDKDIYIWDADTDWKIPINVGNGPYGPQEGDDNVYIYGFYHDAIKD